MTEKQTITCPFCNRQIALTEAFSHQQKEEMRREIELGYAALREELKSKEKSIREMKEGIENEAKRKADESISVELGDLRSQVEEKDKELEKARAQELNLRKLQRELKDRQKNLELEVARKLEAQEQELEKKLEKSLADRYRLKMREKNTRIDELVKRIEELQMKADESSQRIQGEALELDLEAVLTESFPADGIARVAKGRRGADLLQEVRGQSGLPSGKIIWEAKRTRKWNAGWVKKLKEDMRREKADIAVLATKALPVGITGFGMLDGVWICDHAYVSGLAAALRIMLTRVASEKRIAAGKDGKMESLYRYLTGLEFGQRVEAMVEALAAIKQDLDKERRTTQRSWAKREKQIQQGILNIAAMYGEMQGIVGSSLPEVPSLGAKALSPGAEPEEAES